MNRVSLLKPVRVCIALAFFLSVALLFLDFRDTGIRSVAGELLFFQFVPSLLKFLNHAAAGAAGFIAVLAMTFFFGRVYCAALCPLGIFQDMISRLFSLCSKGQKHRRYRFSPPRNLLRYTLLILTILVFAGGSGLVLNLLDPFSSFGRIFSNLFRPLAIALNNLGAPLAETFGIHSIYRVQRPVLAPASFGVALASLGLVGWMSARHGRLFCNTVCPVGTLLGLVSKFSLFRVGFDRTACKACGKCLHVCKAGCIDLKAKQVDTSRCVACFNCLTACPDQAMAFGTGRQTLQQNSDRKNNEQTSEAAGRRDFILALAAGGTGLAANRIHAEPAALPGKGRPTTIAETRTSVLSPPGSQSIARYTSICTACHLCVSACPSRVLQPSVFSFGLSGILQPRMDFNAGHCNYDCTVCSRVCPSGALLPLTVEKKQRTQMGVAKFIKENCVVYTDNTNCGACSEHCPTKAVDMVPYLNAAGRKLVIPKVNEAICVGCGGCEHACPTKPYKAIYVDGNPVHQHAEKPVEKKMKVNAGEDFPF